MKSVQSDSPMRIFGTSAVVTVGVLVGVLFGMGGNAALVTLILVAIEVAFSFDNAIINAKTLSTLSRFWQTIFLTVGMIIAVLGMRVVFPILIVSLSADLSWHAVLNLALHHPTQYAEKLELAHPEIAAFGGGFLLVLALEFFMSGEERPLWIDHIERPLKRVHKVWLPPLVAAALVLVAAAIPANHFRHTTIVAGLLGIIVHVVVSRATSFIGPSKKPAEASNAVEAGSQDAKPASPARSKLPLTGMAAFWTFVYLEVLDASFSFDGVIGAFAVTNKVLLIAAGLGVGALWVRSLTVFMVRKGTLGDYIFLEHGAHYTIAVLAFILLGSIMINIPDAVAGLAGIGIIGASVLASRQALAALPHKKP